MKEKIKKMLGNLFEEFCFESIIQNEHGSPDEWEDDDDTLLERAETYWTWNNHEDVIIAKKLEQAVHVEFSRDRGYTVHPTPHEFNGCINGIPSWDYFGDEESLIHYAKKIFDECIDEAMSKAESFAVEELSKHENVFDMIMSSDEDIDKRVETVKKIMEEKGEVSDFLYKENLRRALYDFGYYDFSEEEEEAIRERFGAL